MTSPVVFQENFAAASVVRPLLKIFGCMTDANQGLEILNREILIWNPT